MKDQGNSLPQEVRKLTAVSAVCMETQAQVLAAISGQKPVPGGLTSCCRGPQPVGCSLVPVRGPLGTQVYSRR